MNVDGGIQISDLSGIARRRAKIMGAVALGVFLAFYWLAMALPNVYTSYATVLVEPQAVDPELVKPGVAQSDLNERLHLMTAQILARGRLSRIIDEEGLYEEESEYMLREEVIDLMRERVRVEPVIPDLQQGQTARREIDINEFQIFFDDYDAIVARNVAQRLANDFIETHINERVQVSQKSVDFIDSELTRLAERIRAVEAEIARVKEENPGRLPEDMTASQRRLEQALGALTIAQRTRDDANSDIGFYESQLSLIESGSVADDASPSRRLELAKLELGDYQSRGYTEKHPDIIKTKAEIEALERQIAAVGGEDETAPMSPLAQQTEAQRRRAVLQKAAAEAEIERLMTIVDEIQDQLAATPAVAEQLDVLNRDYEHLFNTFQDFANRQNEAAVQAQLERRQLGEQFRVLEAAFEAPEPSAPNRLLILILGFVFAGALGVGVGLLIEATDTSPHDARQLQSRLALPVLVSIPEIWLESDRMHQRRARIRTALATAGVVLFALVGGGLNYLWVNGAPRFLETALGGESVEENRPLAAEG